MSKKVFIILLIMLVILLLFLLTGKVLANEKHTTSSTINGASVSWEYYLNNSNQITDLKCANPEVLTGEIAIPSNLDGKTIISLGNDALKNATKVTNITIPDSIEKINYHAFKGCSKLSNVDLGSIKDLSFGIFEDCTSLKEITVPKTLKYGGGTAVFNNSAITKINLEEGLTIVPSCLCANTGITEITIPNSVEKIEYYAFKDCPNLKKIIILDNCKSIGWFISQPNNDSVFNNHNEDLTIYCYEGSEIAKYAIANNIKYIYLTKYIDSNGNLIRQEDTQNFEQEKNEQNISQDEPKFLKDDTDITTAKGILPQTGKITVYLFIAFLLIIPTIIYTRKYIKNKDIN